mmetsp:Transcript_52552/g.104448  ORF Transcript_52552/g.104448 Transcript_52552/m.104448 type:complete len:117 (+) Transcript_52552:59-409(+)
MELLSNPDTNRESLTALALALPHVRCTLTRSSLQLEAGEMYALYLALSMRTFAGRFAFGGLGWTAGCIDRAHALCAQELQGISLRSCKPSRSGAARHLAIQRLSLPISLTTFPMNR